MLDILITRKCVYMNFMMNEVIFHIPINFYSHIAYTSCRINASMCVYAIYSCLYLNTKKQVLH